MTRTSPEGRLLVLGDAPVGEEACIMCVPNVTIRDVTERSETLECGSNILAGPGVADTVCRIVLGAREHDLAEREWQAKVGP